MTATLGLQICFAGGAGGKSFGRVIPIGSPAGRFSFVTATLGLHICLAGGAGGNCLAGGPREAARVDTGADAAAGLVATTKSMPVGIGGPLEAPFTGKVFNSTPRTSHVLTPASSKSVWTQTKGALLRAHTAKSP